VSAAPLPPLPLGRHDRLRHVGGVAVEPREERRPEVEAHARVVGGKDARDRSVRSRDRDRAGGRAIALFRDALVPVRVGGGGGLDPYLARPRVLAGRLVEVAVDAEETGHREGASASSSASVSSSASSAGSASSSFSSGSGSGGGAGGAARN